MKKTNTSSQRASRSSSFDQDKKSADEKYNLQRTGLSPRESDVLVEAIEEIYFSDSGLNGNFLCKIFERWYKNDLGKNFVLNFESSLSRWIGKPSPICYDNEICGKSLAIEHDGNIYSCDHFVYPEYNLGNIKESSIPRLVSSENQINFGLSKINSLPKYCRECSYLFACNGG